MIFCRQDWERAQFDAARSTATAIPPCPWLWPRRPAAGRGLSGFGNECRFRRYFRRTVRRPSHWPFGGFAAAAPPQKGANVAYRLAVSFTTQRRRRRNGSHWPTAAIDRKLPAGSRPEFQMRLAGKGQPGPGGAGDGIVTITVRTTPFSSATAPISGLTCRYTDEAIRAKVKVPTVDGPVMLSVPAGSTRAGDAAERQGFQQKGGGRGDQLVRLMVDPAVRNRRPGRCSATGPTRAVRADLGV